MHWMRIERHYEGEFPDIKVRFQPVMCQQCGHAPCEPVCPVYATYRTPQGLNAMVYARCIARATARTTVPTRSVLQLVRGEWPEPLERQFNPDVSVRPAGRHGEVHLFAYSASRMRKTSPRMRTAR